MYKFIDSSDSTNMPLISYVIEPSDTEQIQRQLLQFMDDSGKVLTNPFTISLIEPVSEQQIEIEINPFEYLELTDCTSYLNLIRT